MQALAHRLADAWLNGVGSFKGFESMFRVPVATGQAIKSPVVDTDLTDHRSAAAAYRTAIADWAASARATGPPDVRLLIELDERSTLPGRLRLLADEQPVS